MSSSIKTPKKGAAGRLREFYNKNIRPGPMSPELYETLKNPEKPQKETSDKKKIARPDRDTELS